MADTTNLLPSLPEDAKEVCEETDPSTKDCAIAWEEVEELQLASDRKLGKENVSVVDASAPVAPGEYCFCHTLRAILNEKYILTDRLTD